MDDFIVTTAIKKLYKLKKRKRIVQGGTSAGKTFGILPILIDTAIRQPGIEISVVSESIPHLRRGALKDFLKIMVLTGRFIDHQFNKSILKYTFTNKSYIEFFSIESADKLRGARRNILYVNEANNIPFDAYNQLAIRTSNTIWIDFNPTSSFWAHTELKNQDDTDFLKLTYKDNEALSDAIVKDIEKAKGKALTSNYWKNWWTVYGLGEVGALEGACIKDWYSMALPGEARLLCYGMDFGYTNDPTTVVAMYKWNNAYVFDEVLYKKGLLNSGLSSLLKQGDHTEIIYADSAEPKSIAELCSYGHTVLPCQKGKDSIVYGINLLNQQELYITPKSVNLIKELQNYIWMVNKDGTTLNRPIDNYNHCIDAMRYAITSQLANPGHGEYHIY
ncbi:MAG: putative terminase large subunit [Prokaryotic dsDNA virus sp.]|nr:MAG: putative terminase large subunit [Prokaryotic dsDNA virus sp.]|tara:strand:+ start:23 stop:1192 length:1170 start_codon:yes stop_codon:yes gene_type:complete